MTALPRPEADLVARYRSRYRVLLVVSLLLAAALSVSVYELAPHLGARGTAALTTLNLTTDYIGGNNRSWGPISGNIGWVGPAPHPLEGPVGSAGPVSVGLYDNSTTGCTLWDFWVHAPFTTVAWHVENHSTFWLDGRLPIGIQGKVSQGSGWISWPTGVDLNLTLPSTPGDYELGLTIIVTC